MFDSNILDVEKYRNKLQKPNNKALTKLLDITQHKSTQCLTQIF